MFPQNNMTKKQQISFQKIKENKASKAELKILIKWAEHEVKEWNKFLVECKNKLDAK